MLRTRTNRRAWAVCGVLVLGGGLWVGRNLLERELPKFQAGTAGPVVQLVAVTVGTDHVSGSWLGRILHLLPGSAGRLTSVQARFPVVALTTPKPAVVVHLDVRYGTPPPPASRRSWHVFLADETGAASQVEENPLPMGVAGRMAAVFTAVPRRQRELRLQFYQEAADGSLALAGTLRAPNPWFGEFPQWPNPAWPARATNGSLVGVIETLHRDAPRRDYYREAFQVSESELGGELDRSWHQQGMWLHGRFTTPAHPEEAWTIASAEVSDATGNALRFEQLATPEAQDHRSLWIKPHLWPGERAWRLRLGFKRSSGIPATNRFEVHGLELTEAGASPSMLTRSAHWGPVTAHFRPMTNGVGQGTRDAGYRPRLSLVVDFENRPADWVVDLVSVRASGEELASSNTAASGDPRTGSLTFALEKVPSAARHLDLVFAAQPLRVLEFLVPPNAAPSR